MNFLGRVGAVMSRSGIEELLEELNMENLSHHLMYGKAYARSLHGHMLIHSALL
jgi:hypothetical protein